MPRMPEVEENERPGGGTGQTCLVILLEERAVRRDVWQRSEPALAAAPFRLAVWDDQSGVRQRGSGSLQNGRALPEG